MLAKVLPPFVIAGVHPARTADAGAMANSVAASTAASRRCTVTTASGPRAAPTR